MVTDLTTPQEVVLRDLTTMTEEGEVVEVAYTCRMEEDMMEVVRREGTTSTTTCLDFEGRVLTSTVVQEDEVKGEEEEERQEGDVEGLCGEDERKELGEREVWVADGEMRRERMVMPGGREAVALYQVSAPSLDTITHLQDIS